MSDVFKWAMLVFLLAVLALAVKSSRYTAARQDLHDPHPYFVRHYHYEGDFAQPNRVHEKQTSVMEPEQQTTGVQP